ncbi:unnamed protein product [Cuscuta europaea]|uniref:Reverse transcriptase Ty1/copia-type domain-containing protein n=1 Tax=Cuscuta europaea TaxID=41803 RepID=A0A9P0YNN8_CUSEU|nr:unnamed protein product [Cuscuta europaea]
MLELFIVNTRTSYGVKYTSSFRRTLWPESRARQLKSELYSTGKGGPSLLIFVSPGIQIYILIYVDDILVIGNNSEAIQQLIHKLHSSFSLKHLGDIDLF